MNVINESDFFDWTLKLNLIWLYLTDFHVTQFNWTNLYDLIHNTHFLINGLTHMI